MVAQTAGPRAAFESLSPNDAIQFILADIPVFCVGILALGTFTFFFLMKRVDRWVFCLHLSAIVSFLAAIFDLSQLLIQGRSSNEATVPSGVTGLITAREVFYSFANGLRLLFYWGFVAMIPLGETIPDGNKMHSGSWRRWGLAGLVLKWSTLFLVFLITLLQLIFRDVPALDQIGPVYETAATLEMILSAVFILKLLLNTWARFSVGSSTPSKGKMLVQYAPIIVALLFSLWISLGNVILFQFTETALGHFMRAIEVYIAVVYMLTISFHHLRHLSFFPVYRPATRSNSLKRPSIEKSGEMISAKIVSEPKNVDLADIIQENYRTAQEVPQTIERNSARSAKVEGTSQHQSMAARLSTWLGVTQPQQARVHSWDVDTERGPSPAESVVITPWYAPEPQPDRPPSVELVQPPVSDVNDLRGASPIPDSPVDTKPQERPPLSATSYSAQPVDTEQEKTPIPDRDWQDLEYSNAVRDSGIGDDVLARALSQKYYKTQDDSPIAANIQVVEPATDDEVSVRPDSIDATSQYIETPYPSSPLASATVTPLARSRPLPPMPVPNRPTSMLPSPISPMVPDSARSSNISVLVRRQNELDESIAALRLFSPSKQQFDINQAPATSAMYDYQYSQGPSGETAVDPATETGVAAYAESWTSPDLPLTTTPKPQLFARSDFYFDQQPPLNRMSTDSAVIPVDNRLKSSSQLAPPRMPVSRFSDGSSVGERDNRIDSMGTQYDITSFVGNLTVPMNHTSLMSSTSAAYSEEGSVNVARIANPPTFARPTLITQQATLSVPRVEQGSSMVMSTSLAARRALPPIPQHSSLLQVPQVQAPKPVATSDVPPRFRRAVGLPAHPRPQLSMRNLTPVDEKSSPSDTATTLLTSPLSGSGTPLTGKA